MERTNRILAEAEVSPNYQRLLGHGDAESVGDILAAGSDAAVEKRLRSFADAGVTDLSVRVVPIGAGRDELIASSERTRALLEQLASAGCDGAPGQSGGAGRATAGGWLPGLLCGDKQQGCAERLHSTVEQEPKMT